MPIVSVIMPVYNGARHIEAAIRSVLAQTLTDWELIVVDDGSTDETCGLVEQFQDSRIRVIRQPNAGQSNATNTGLKASRGDYVQFLDADDLLDPDKMERQFNALRTSGDNCFSICKWAFFRSGISDATFKEEPIFFSGNTLDWLCTLWSNETMMPNNGYFFSRPVLERAGLYYADHLMLNIDFEYFTRATLAADQVVYVPEAICYYRKGLTTAKTYRPAPARQRSALASRIAAIEYLLERSPTLQARQAARKTLTILTYSFPGLLGSIQNHLKRLNLGGFDTFGGRKFRMLAHLVGFKNAVRIKGILESLGEHKQRRRNILVITGWPYRDGLVQSYTLPYLKLIHEVSPPSQIRLVTEEREPVTQQTVADVNLQLLEWGIHWHPSQYRRLGILKYLSTLRHLANLLWIMIRHDISHIHTICTPAGLLGYLLSRLTGKPHVVDSFEPHSAYMLESHVWASHSLAYRLLFAAERKMAAHAANVIATTEGMKEFSRHIYGVDSARFFVKPACVDLNTFRYNVEQRARIRDELGLGQHKVCVYLGKLGGNYLDREVFDFCKAAYSHWEEQFSFMLLSPNSEDLEQFCTESGLPRHHVVIRQVPHAQVPHYLSAADFGITPVRPAPSKRYLTPIKNGEYWAMGLPIIITRDISDDSRLIEDLGIGAVLHQLDQKHYLGAVRKLDHLWSTHTPEQLREKIRAVADQYRNFRIARKIFAEIYG